MAEGEDPAESPGFGERLESWKEIAAHLKRGVTTVQRWEKEEGLPVHRHLHKRLGTVWAQRSEVDAWWRERQALLEREPERDASSAVRIKTAAAMGIGLLVLAAGIGWAVLRGSPEAAPPRPVPLTSLEGREMDPALSPDGKALAFVWDEGRGREALYVQSVAGHEPRRLAAGPGICCPSWSPDGRSIAFVRQHRDEGRVVVAPSQGGTERAVATLQPWYGTALAWSPDARQLAYPDRRTATDAYSIVVLSIDSLEVRNLTRPGPGTLGDAFPSYSDNGKSLAFARVLARGDALPSDVYVLKNGSTEPTRLTTQGGLIGGLDWAPESRDIVYAAVLKGDEPRLWRVSASGRGEPVVLAGPVPSETVAETASAVSHALRISVSRGGRQVAYVRRLYDTNIWSLSDPARPGGATPTRRLIASTQPDEGPQYSPDGQRIAFASSRSGPPEIWTCARDGTDCAALTRLGVHSGTPRWSPDGRHVAFDSRPAGQSDIYMVAVQTGQVTRVTASTAEDVVPSWSRDGRHLYFASNRGGSWQVYRAGVQGGEATQVSGRGGFVAFEAPDALYLSRHDERGLWRIPRTGGSESKVVDEPGCWGHWALAEEGVYMLDAGPGPGTRLEFYGFATGQKTTLRTIAETAPCAESSLALAPDGKDLLYVAVEERSDIMLARIP